MQRRIIETTPLDAAAKLNIDMTTMYRRLERRRIAAIKEGARWRVFLAEIRLTPDSEPFYNSLPYSALHYLLGGDLLKLLTQEE